MTKAEVKTLAICFILLLTARIVFAADNTATNSATPIPWNQIGAKAGVDYKGDGLAVSPTESGARLHCLFQRLDAEATPEGLWLTSSALNTAPDRFRVTAIEVGRAVQLPRTAAMDEVLAAATSDFTDAAPSFTAPTATSDFLSLSFPRSQTHPASTPLSATGIVTIDAQTVRFTRPGLTEEYTVSMDGLRQDFIVQQPPPSPSPLNGDHDARSAQLNSGNTLVAGLGSQRAGVRGVSVQSQQTTYNSVILKLSITGANFEPAPDGATLILQSSGRKISYNRLRVTDATAKELPAHIEVCPVADEATSLKPLDLLSDDFGQPNANLAIVIDDSNARYPLRIDPTFSDANWVSLGVIPGANGGVNAMATDSSGDVVIAGSFSSIGSMSANNIALWNRTNWASLGSGIVGPVNALVFFGGKVYAGGSFSTAGGQTINNLAQWDGTNWSALGSGINGGVASLAVARGTMYVAGGFSTAGGVTANQVAQWDGTNWAAVGSGAGYGGSVLAWSGSQLYTGGNAPGQIIQWDGTNWSSLPSGVSAGHFSPDIFALAAAGGNLYVGGAFSKAGSVSVNNIARWDGSSWSALGSGVTGNVKTIAVSGTNVYVGGNFATAGGLTVNSVARWDGSSWSTLASGMDGEVDTLSISGGTLYAGGGFGVAGSSAANGIAQWNGSSWSALGVGNPGLGGAVYALAASSNTLYVGGLFTLAGNVPVNNIAQWNGTGWAALGSGMGGYSPYVFALAVSGSTLYAGGYFTTAGGNPANYIAQWDGTNWSGLGSGMNEDGQVQALAVSGSTLYAGGDFTSAGGVPANWLAQWDGTNWSALGSGISGNPPGGEAFGVNALAAFGGKLYVGGGFLNAGGGAANYIAQWDGSSWSSLGTGMDNEVFALAVFDNALYAGGIFANAGGVPANYIARWDGSSWSALGSGVNAGVSALAASDKTLYAGGGFDMADGFTVNGIAQWNGTNWSAMGSGMNGSVNALTISGNALFAGGYFTTAGAKYSAYATEALLNGPPPPTILTTDGNFGITNGLFGFNVSGRPASNVVIQSSPDLQTWTPLQTNSLGSGTIYFSDPQPPAATQRFYRAQLSP